MARAIKKVKVKKPRTKKFWITLSSIIGVVVLAAVAVTLYFVLKDDDDTYDYFADIKAETNATYYEVNKKTQNASKDHMFVFVYDKTFDPEDNTTDKEMEVQIILLYNKIKNYNENYDDDFYFYIVDTSVSRNKAILSDATFGSVSTSNQLIYLFEGKSTKYPDNYDAEKAIIDGVDEICGSTVQEVKQAIDYIEDLKKYFS